MKRIYVGLLISVIAVGLLCSCNGANSTSSEDLVSELANSSVIQTATSENDYVSQNTSQNTSQNQGDVNSIKVTTSSESSSNNTKRITPTIDMNFKDDRVIIVLKPQYSSIGGKFDVSRFETQPSKDENGTSKPIIFTRVEDMYYIADKDNALVNKEQFGNILCLYLQEKGKQNVLDAIAQLEKREDVWFAEPSYNYKVKYDTAN